MSPQASKQACKTPHTSHLFVLLAGSTKGVHCVFHCQPHLTVVGMAMTGQESVDCSVNDNIPDT